MSVSPERHYLAQVLQSALASAVDQAAVQPAINSLPTKAISFSPELVRAILDGRKSETRRLIRPHPKRRPSIAKCAIARPGDRLHVREPWAEHEGRIIYAADGATGVPRYRPAMYMPRAASRLTLQVTSVRAERLTAITPAAALAEGAPADHADPRIWFAGLWDRIFTTPGERWADDPFVWVIQFKCEPLAQAK